MNLKKQIAAHVREIPKSGIREFFDIVAQEKEVISLGVGEPDFDTPWHIREAAIYSLEQGRTHYTSNLGLPELRSSICRYVQKHFGIAYDPRTEVIITVGVSEAIDLALRALLNPGDEVLYHEPCYVSYSPSVVMAHGRAIAVPTRAEDNFRLTAEALAARITERSKVLMLNFPCNPTGATQSRSELEKIARLCIDHDLVVLTDEIYSELTYDGAEHVSIASLPGMRERCIFLHGFSKAFAMTGFRIGYACAPAILTDAMMKIHQYAILCANTMAQDAAIEALENGEREVQSMRREYEQRRNYIVRSMNQLGLECFQPVGAFYIFPKITASGLSSREFSLGLLEKKKVACVPGTAFGPSGEGFVRCCYATSMEQIKVAMERIADFLAELKKVSAIRKAVVLAAGKGTRMRELTNDLPKPMIAVRGKPILQHIVEGLAAAGVREFLIVVGYRADVVRAFFNDGSAFGVAIEYIEQITQDGTGRVVELARDFASEDPFVLSYGDILIAPENYQRLVQLGDADALISVKHNPGEIAQGGAVFVNERFELTDLREKPQPGEPTSPWYNAGVYAFRPSIFTHTAALEKSPRGEYELTDAIRTLAQSGALVQALELTGEWADVRDPEVLAALNAAT